MRVIVTGGTGYIGRVLIPDLLKAGHDVTVIDRGFLEYDDPAIDFGQDVRILREDIRTCDPEIFKSQEAVIDLAALSNDPSGDLNKLSTWDINYIGRVRVARLAKKVGIKKYVVASSCSVYGFRDGLSNENTPVNPLTTYAEANVSVERDNLALNDRTFRSTALRFATVFGYSPRFRLDLVINAMSFYGYKNKTIRMMRDGNQFRPFIHVRDAARALREVVESEDSSIGGRFINIGNESLNVKIRDIAELIRTKIGNEGKIELYGDPDNRSYQVDFSLARELLNFKTHVTIEDGVREILEQCKGGLEDKPQMHTVEYYKHLLSCGKEMARFQLDSYTKLL